MTLKRRGRRKKKKNAGKVAREGKGEMADEGWQRESIRGKPIRSIRVATTTNTDHENVISTTYPTQKVIALCRHDPLEWGALEGGFYSQAN